MLSMNLENVSEDLGKFAQSVIRYCPLKASLGLTISLRHAGRKTITTEDVMLLARRNEELAVILRTSLDQMTAS